jgi:hypothetical protein
LACYLQIDADPDPAYHFDVDPDPAYQFNADPDSTFQFEMYRPPRAYHPHLPFVSAIKSFLCLGVRCVGHPELTTAAFAICERY